MSSSMNIFRFVVKVLSCGNRRGILTSKVPLLSSICMVVSYFNSRPHLYVAIFTSEKGISLGILLLLFSMFIERDGGKIILVSLYYLFCEGAN